MPTAPCVASHMASLKSNKLPECLMCRSPHPLHVPGLSSLNHLFLSFFYKSILSCLIFLLLLHTASLSPSHCHGVFRLYFVHGSLSVSLISDNSVLQSLLSVITVQSERNVMWEKKHLISKIVHYYYWSLLLEPDRCICRGHRPLLAI